MRSLLLALCLLVYVVSPAQSWGPIAHYQLGVESGSDPNGSFQNLPDSWPAYHNPFKDFFRTVLELPDAFNITEYFAWSHGVMRTGRTRGVPNVPQYHRDGWNPGQDMYDLYKRGTVSGSAVYETAIGFLAHYVQDRAVHYRYFRGGSLDAWREEHLYKEVWTDCWIFRWRIAKSEGFDQNGRPRFRVALSNRGNADLIAEAQRMFIRFGRSTDLNGVRLLSRSEHPSEIRARMRDYEQELTRYVSRLHRRICDDQYFQFFRRYAWDLDELLHYFQKSLEATEAVLIRFPR